MLEIMPFTTRHMSNYNPFREIEEFEKRFFGENTISSFKTDIRDNGDSYTLEADLPGFNKEDISVSIDGDYLTIKAERKTSSEKNEKDQRGDYVRLERSFGAFERSFEISEVNAEAISAKYNNGVLTLDMPKKEKEIPTSRKLEIN